MAADGTRVVESDSIQHAMIAGQAGRNVAATVNATPRGSGHGVLHANASAGMARLTARKAARAPVAVIRLPSRPKPIAERGQPSRSPTSRARATACLREEAPSFR